MKKRIPTADQLPPKRRNERVLVMFLVNISLAIFWYIFFPVFGAGDFLLGFGVGALALTVYERMYGRRIWWLVTFVLFVLWEVFLSNAELTWAILQPRPRFKPGIVAVPLTLNTNFEILVLVTVITLMPGSVSIDLHRDEKQSIVYIHSFYVEDPDAYRQEIKEVFERRLSQVTRGGWV